MITITSEHDAMRHFLHSEEPVLCIDGADQEKCHAFYQAALFFRTYRKQKPQPKTVLNPKPNTWYSIKDDGLPSTNLKVNETNIVTLNPTFSREIYIDEWTGKKFASGDGVKAWMIIKYA